VGGYLNQNQLNSFERERERENQITLISDQRKEHFGKKYRSVRVEKWAFVNQLELLDSVGCNRVIEGYIYQ